MVKIGRVLVISGLVQELKKDLQTKEGEERVRSFLYDLVDCTTEMEHGERIISYLKDKGVTQLGSD